MYSETVEFNCCRRVYVYRYHYQYDPNLWFIIPPKIVPPQDETDSPVDFTISFM